MEFTASAKAVRSRKEAWKACKSSKVKNEINLTEKRIKTFRKCCTHSGFDPYVQEYLHNTHRVKVVRLLTNEERFFTISKSLGKGTKGNRFRWVESFQVVEKDNLLQAIQECTAAIYTFWDSNYKIENLSNLYYDLRNYVRWEDVDEEETFKQLLVIANLIPDELYVLAKTKYPWVFKEEE